MYAPTAGLSNPSSTCDDASANPRHLFPSVKLMLACWGPLSTRYGCLLIHCRYFYPEHSLYGALLVSLTVRVHLSFPLRHCIYVSLWQCSTGRSSCFPVAGGLRCTGEWVWVGDTEGLGERLVNHFKPWSFLWCLPRNLACLSFRTQLVSRAIALIHSQKNSKDVCLDACFVKYLSFGSSWTKKLFLPCA